jgi:hypothetical protein
MRVLVAIITGGRPALADRRTRDFTEPFQTVGFTDIEWVLRSDHVTAYEKDDLPQNVYAVEWANDYAKAHWRHSRAPYEPGGFFGAFPGREWAMRTAEDRGYDLVLQLDDNVLNLGLLNSNRPAFRAVMNPGACALTLCDLAVSTNAHMLGAQLASVPPSGLTSILRPGFPYSVFVEKTGSGRMPYHGPFEDDIMHALEYGLHGGPNRTAAVAELIRYNKEHTARSGGMRSKYDASRGLEIANRYPQNVRLGMGSRSSSPSDTKRGVRHFLTTRGFTPITVTDPDLFHRADQRLREGVQDAIEAKREWDRTKIQRRAQQTGRA